MRVLRPGAGVGWGRAVRIDADPFDLLVDSDSIRAATPCVAAGYVLSHHHPDHTLNAALFPNARFHDRWAIYERDRWTDRAADGVLITPSVRLIAMPGHSRPDITTLVGTADGVVACHQDQPRIHTPKWTSRT